MSSSLVAFDGRKLCRSVLALLGSGILLAGSEARAATVTWSGAGGDSLWSNPLNWNGGILPTNTDDVVIDAPGSVAVHMDVPFTTVRSLQCQESFLVEGNFFTVTAGASVINGAFRMNAGLWLVASGPTALLTINGAVTNVSGLQADSGGVIALPSARKLTIDGTTALSYDSRLNANGAGSAILMTNLTNIVMSAPYRLVVTASEGGLINLSGLRVPAAPLEVTATDAGSVVDLSGLAGEWNAPDSALLAANGGSVLIPGVTAMRNLSLELRYDAIVPTAQIRSMLDSTTTVYGRTNGFEGLTNFTGTLYLRDHSRMDWTNLTVLHATNLTFVLFAIQGSRIDLSGVTNVVSIDGNGLIAYVSGGSRIDVSRLRRLDGQLALWATEPDSVLDFTSLSGGVHGGFLRADYEGSVLIPNVTTLENTDYDVRGSANVSLTQLASITDGSLHLESRTNDLSSLTNFSGFISVVDTRLYLTNLTVLYATNMSLKFEAAEGSVIDVSSVTNVVTRPPYTMVLRSVSGSRIALQRLERINANYAEVLADGMDAVVDLSGLTEFFTDNNSGSLMSRDGGAVLLNTNALLLAGVTLDLQSNPGGVPYLPASQSLTLYGRPNESYRVESRNSAVPGSPWTLYARVPQTALLEVLGPRPPAGVQLRVTVMLADPPEVSIRRAGPGQVEVILFGIPGQTYSLSSKTTLDAGIWEDGPPTTLNSSFHIFPAADATDAARYFRALGL